MLSRIAFLALLIMTSVAHAESSFETSNCRTMSTKLKYPDGTPRGRYHDLVDDRTKDRLLGAAGDVGLEECKRDLAVDILSAIANPETHLTQTSDDGYVEYSEPGRKGEYTHCRYHVDQNQPVSDVLLQYSGVIHATIINFYPFEKQIGDEGMRLVKIECDAVS